MLEPRRESSVFGGSPAFRGYRGERAKQKALMGLDQIGIALSGVIAVWLTQDKRESWRRWACIFGMLGQPFWFYAAWKAEQWGILAISLLSTYAWARGIWTYWLATERAGPAPNEGNS